MGRSTNFVGMPDGLDKIIGKTDIKCGQVKDKYPYDIVNTGEKIYGMVGEELDSLKEYHKDGKLVYREKVQCAPWSSGPCIFLKLVDANGKDCLVWTEKEIDEYV